MDDILTPILFLLVIAASVATVVFYLRKKDTKKTFFSATPTLDHFSLDLTDLAKRGALDPIIGRKAEIDQLTRVLSRRTKNNVVLIGKSGIGKTTIVEGLAQNIINCNII